MFPSLKSSKQKDSITTIAFYNVENLFDIFDNPTTADDDFTPKGKLKWTLKRYKVKIRKLGSVISQLGLHRSSKTPAIVGLVEVENASVVADLAHSSYLKKHHYGYVHHDSPDERGIDVALLYSKVAFELFDSSTYPVFLEDENAERDFTRDILKVSGKLHGELVHILVNHWPSRREGTEISEPKRIATAITARAVIDTINQKEMNPKIILMGDFNDDPSSKSVKDFLVKDDFFNPMESLVDKDKRGTSTYNKKWNFFDQIMLSKNFLDDNNNEELTFKHAEVFNKKWLRIFRGKLKGSPFRTYIGPWYQGGFSDHFPVYVFLKKEN